MKSIQFKYLKTFGLVILTMSLALTSCKNSSTSAIEEDDMASISRISPEMTPSTTTGSNVLFEDDFESNSLSDYIIGSFGQAVGSASISNGEFLVNGNFVKSFSPNVNFNGTQIATDGGFSICMNVSPLSSRPGGTSSAVRLSVSLGHENTSDAVTGFDGNANDGFYRLRGFLGEAIIGGSKVTYDEDPAFGKSYKMTLTVDTDEISAGTPYTATLYMDGEEVGVFSGKWNSENNYLGFHAIDGNWSFDNLVINSSSSSPCLPTTTTNVFISDNSVDTYDPLFPDTEDKDWLNNVCKQSNDFGITATWSNPHKAFQITKDPSPNGAPHPWESNTFDAFWINTVNDMDSPDTKDITGNAGPGGHNWTRYETQVAGNGEFVVQLVADNCSWVYLADENGDSPELIGFQATSAPGEYSVSLDGDHQLIFIIFDGGGLAGGKFRLETTESFGGTPPPPIETNNAPNANAGGDQTLDATGQTTSVTLDGSGSSDADGDALTYTWSNGATGATPTVNLPDGTHTLTLTVSDGEESSTDEVTITVVNTIPVADAGDDITKEATGVSTSVTLTGSGSDADGDDLTFTWSNGNTGSTTTVDLGVGVHTFTLTVSDGQGASDSDEVVVEVIDNAAPGITFTQQVNNLWPPNHKMVLVATGISATDNVDGSTNVDVTVTSNESSNGKGDGNTESDFEIVTHPDGSKDVYVRAERSGKKDGRIYTITMNAADSAGNSSEASFEVQVEKSQGRAR